MATKLREYLAVLFDFDGTLADSYAAIAASVNHVRAQRGYSALSVDEVTRAIPVVMVTSKDQPADEFWAKEVGADAFVPKPVDVIELAAQLDRLKAGV